MLANPLLRNFTVTNEDIESLVNLLLEQETPMNTQELALILLERRLDKERASLEAQYQDASVYKPQESYNVDDRLIFTAMDYATATITDIRDGENPDYGAFKVATVEFDDADLNSGTKREFAIELQGEHALNEIASESPLDDGTQADPKQLLADDRNTILRTVANALLKNPMLERVAGYWFPKDLVMEFDIGTMHLAEAVLDMAGGGPLATQEIIEQIGGLGDSALALQVFSLNLALKDDDRFEEVGPAGKVLWYLSRMAPEYVREVPPLLKYTPIEYDDELLSDDMFDLETELDDEWTEIEFEGRLRKATSTIIYPHRRAGTLPLNAKNRAIFPIARTPRIFVELVDTSDDETYAGWVLHDELYVYGLLDYYTKHRLPVGAFVSIERGEHAGQILLSHESYKPRTEWIRILTPQNNSIKFENKKRAIGAEYHDRIIIGVDDLEAVDELSKAYRKKSIAAILRELIQELSKLSPQGTVHATTLYSAVNVMRRCAPGPIFATLTANPDFVDVGDYYWTLNE